MFSGAASESEDAIKWNGSFMDQAMHRSGTLWRLLLPSA
jgi:hypothetical protein